MESVNKDIPDREFFLEFFSRWEARDIAERESRILERTTDRIERYIEFRGFLKSLQESAGRQRLKREG